MELYRNGYPVPVPPGFARGAVFSSLPSELHLVADTSTTVVLYSFLYSPDTWSLGVNTDVYAFVALALQAAKALNITAPGGRKYNVPTGNITIDYTGDTSPDLVSYSQVAIAGADDFYDGGVTIKDVFDVIVNTTRTVTPTCRFPIILSNIC